MIYYRLKLIPQKDKITDQSKLLERINKDLLFTNTELKEKNCEIESQKEELHTQKEQLEELNQQLLQLVATKDKFFSIIAHDLRNPFQSIAGFVELLKNPYEKTNEEKKHKYIDIIYTTTKNTYSLLENLLNWARTQTGNISYKPTHFQLENIILQKIDIQNSGLEEKKIKINTKFNNNMSVFADENMTSTIIRNLFSNAINFTNSGGKITISKDSYKEGSVQVCVEDTGIGINVTIMKTLFKIDKSRSKKGTEGEIGSGLGLILCKELVEKNDGKIWVESEPGEGSKFYFTLPVSQ